MPQFSKASLAKLETIARPLQEVLKKAIENGPDFTIITGARSKEEQDAAFAKGVSKVRWPNSKHNTLPSAAVDVAPYPIDWKDINRFRVLAGYLMGVAAGMGIKLRSGMDWNQNWSEKDEHGLRDFGHLEIRETQEVKPQVSQSAEDGNLDLIALREIVMSDINNFAVVRTSVAELLRRVDTLEKQLSAKA